MDLFEIENDKGPCRTKAPSNILQFFASQKLAQILQFPIFNGGCIKLVSSDQNCIDWHTRQSQTHLPLLKDKEKILAQITGQE